MPYELAVTFEQGDWLLLRGVETVLRRPVFAATTSSDESAGLRRSWIYATNSIQPTLRLVARAPMRLWPPNCIGAG